ncbi:transcriptional regulator, TetR family [Roseateles sp. YR242]|uniref:TetR/AcrR family transcriptional regulator n=1 Tax=Roseateles sp. YR242 TaxID=1855305 RepID=UPI0008C4623F|nr:TetR/AcrR family transcriptional regulator [Roseateles sp. YR242]SEL08425.1 transcriptional regulator, TetR family [Roseateles sp. YR242]
MKVTKQQSAANRQALVDAAARLYRERGVAGVGLAEISREAGFTHGGFYGRFDSKEALAAEACTAAMDMGLERLTTQLSQQGGDLRQHLERYLSPAHRDAPGAGCAMAALAVDAAREGGQLGQAMSDGVAAYLQTLARHRPDGTVMAVPDAEDKARAILLVSAMVGALTLSRACAAAAPELSEEILTIAREALTAGFGHQARAGVSAT